MPTRVLAPLFALLLCWPFLAGAQDGAPVATAGPGLPGGLTRLVESTLARFTLGPDADEADEERELRRAERAVREALATEGYFDPKFRFEPGSGGRPPYRLIVELGPLTRVTQVDLRFSGALGEPRFAERAEQLRAAWPLKVGTPFRSTEWEQARLRLLASVEERDFAGARIADSRAEVRPETASATLVVEVDSGPAYTVGALQIDGLSRFDASLVERYNPFRPGDRYERSKLVEFQQLLQDTPYFSNAVATLQLAPEAPEQVPLKVVIRESRLRRFSAGLGYETDTGAHLEVAYRQNVLFGNPWVLQTGARVDTTGGLGFVDVLFPPRPSGVQDSVGTLGEYTELEDLFVQRWGIGAARTRTAGPVTGNNVVTRWSVNFEHENRRIPTTDWQSVSALSTTYSWVRRNVNNVIEPRSGNIIRLEGSVGLSGTSLDDVFIRGFGRVQHYFPIGGRDVLIVRGDLGYVQADSVSAVPTRFLFRTGGTTTVRGYNFESLGVKQGSAVISGRALAVGSVEYVKWLERFGGNWGVAAFVDAGDAAERFTSLDIAIGAGLGVRFRTPAGPLAVDVAYGERENQVRVHFSVAIAF